MEINKVVLYQYRYTWTIKNLEDGKESVCVRYITGPVEEHSTFMDSLYNSEMVVTAIREYINEIHYSALLKGVEEIKKLED